MFDYTTKSGIYLLRNKINNKIYIGKSINLKQRLLSHRYDKRINNSLIIKAIQKYGWENFDVEILETFDDIDNDILLDKESMWIQKLNSTDRDIGYNTLTYSSDRTGVPHTEKTKEKISTSRIGKYTGRKNPFYGKHHDMATKEKFSKDLISSGKYAGENNPMYGKHHTEETKKKISKTRKEKGVAVGENNPFYGKKHSKEFLETKKRPVKQINLETGEIIKIWPSIKDACIGIHGVYKNRSCISNVCRKYKLKNGRSCKSAFGFGWEYA